MFEEKVQGNMEKYYKETKINLGIQGRYPLKMWLLSFRVRISQVTNVSDKENSKHKSIVVELKLDAFQELKDHFS